MALRLSIQPIHFSYDPVADLITSVPDIPRATGETRALKFAGGVGRCAPAIWVMGGGRTPPNPSNEVDIHCPDGPEMDDRSAIRYRPTQFPDRHRRRGNYFRHRPRLAGRRLRQRRRAAELDGNLLPYRADTERASADDAYSDIYSDPDRYIAPAHANSNRRI